MMINSLLFVFILLPLSYIFCDPIELSEIIIPEHTSIGHLLLTLNSSTINQRYSYRFVSSNHREIQQYFSLNSSSGELHIVNDIDREKICTQRHTQCKFLLKIFELFHETLYHIPILIDDINDHRPIFPYESSILVLHISENSPPYQSKLFIQQAYDQDQIDNQKQLKYELKNVENNFPFRLETNVDVSNRLALILIQSLDRERIDIYNCTLHVTDTAGHDEQLYIKIIIDDVNDQSPIFQNETYSIQLSELTPINTTILQVQAKDADIGLNGEIIYDFTDASKQFSNIFSLDKQTGVVRIRSLLDYEQRSSYVFYIQAHDLGKESRSSQTLVNITVLDENDCTPKITFRFLPEIIYIPSKDLIEISETYPIDKFFAQILVTDDDSNYRGQTRLWFEIIDSHKEYDQSFSLYQIDNITYFFNRTKSFDFEIQQWHRLIFYAQDFDPKNPLQTSQILTIHVLDENDHPPIFRHSFYRINLNENNQENIFLKQIEAFDPDSGENGRLTYEILTNETSLPFYIDINTGMLYCSKSLDREKRDRYDFYVIANDHGYPMNFSSKIHVRIDINDLNDNPPKFEKENYEFFLEENSKTLKSIGFIRAYDLDLNSKLTYFIQNKLPFSISQNGELFVQNSIDREKQDLYLFNVTVSDNYFKSIVSVRIKILDINDCIPIWKKPSENNTILIMNKDRTMIGTTIVTIEAIDYDEKSNGNGLISYSIEEIEPIQDEFLILLNTGELILNGTSKTGRYRVLIKAKDNGKLIQYSSFIQFYLLIGDNKTNGSLFYDLYNNHNYNEQFLKINSLSITKRVILLSTFFISIAIILAFIVGMILILICRYRRQKYLYYIKCKAAQATGNHHHHHTHDPTMIIVENRLTDFDEKNSSSNSSKLSLENLQQKRLIGHLSSPSYTGANIYTQQQHHHPNHISSTIKPNQTTSDYYSNSSKHEEDIDEWIDEQQQQRTIIDTNNQWSIEKILYPDWLYKGSMTTTTTTTPPTKKNLNTSTFVDFNSYRTFETNGSTTSNSSNGRRTMSSSLTSNGQPSPKQVRFGCQQQTDEQTRSYPHLSTTIKQLRTATTTTTAILKDDDADDTFI